MTPTHHPSDALLISYASGSLGAGMSIVVASHLALCPACRTRAAAAEAVGGALFEALPPADMDAGALERMMARLDEPEPRRPDRVRPTPARNGLALPSPVLAVTGTVTDRSWRRLAPGIRQVEVVPRDRRGGSVRLFRIAPGSVMPHHSHRGIELTLVLSGSYSDELGHFERGDFAETDGDTHHQPVADKGAECVCLIATEAPLRFRDLVPRLFQPLFGI